MTARSYRLNDRVVSAQHPDQTGVVVQVNRNSVKVKWTLGGSSVLPFDRLRHLPVRELAAAGQSRESA